MHWAFVAFICAKFVFQKGNLSRHSAHILHTFRPHFAQGFPHFGPTILLPKGFRITLSLCVLACGSWLGHRRCANDWVGQSKSIIPAVVTAKINITQTAVTAARRSTSDSTNNSQHLLPMKKCVGSFLFELFCCRKTPPEFFAAKLALFWARRGYLNTAVQKLDLLVPVRVGFKAN